MKNRFVFPSLVVAETGEAPAPIVESTPHLLIHQGCQLHYWMSGSRSAPVVVLIHGEGGNHHCFDLQVQRLAASYRVITWDLRGHGLSHSAQTFSLEQAVDDLQAILLHEGYTNVMLVGLSVGGLIAQRFAQRFPGRVGGLVLFSCLPFNAQVSPAARLFDRLSTEFLRLLPYWFILAQMPAYVSIRPEVQRYTAEAMQESGKKQFLAARQASFQHTAAKPAQSLPQPVLVAFGAYDRKSWLARAAELWARALPAANIVSVPGAGHSLNQDNPSYTNKMLSDFLSQCVWERRQAQAARA